MLNLPPQLSPNSCLKTWGLSSQLEVLLKTDPYPINSNSQWANHLKWWEYKDNTLALKDPLVEDREEVTDNPTHKEEDTPLKECQEFPPQVWSPISSLNKACRTSLNKDSQDHKDPNKELSNLNQLLLQEYNSANSKKFNNTCLNS